MTSTSLTDRYVWAVSRRLPDETGRDVARELRGTIEETIEGRIAAGEEPAAAERATIVDLGDPEVLARAYGGRPNHLIGPDYYQPWIALVRMLLTIVLPIVVTISCVAAAFADGADLGTVIGTGVETLVTAGVHMLAWPTLVFALIERSDQGKDPSELGLGRWDPDRLEDPEVAGHRASAGEAISEVVLGLVLLGLVVWQLAGVEEHALQILDPALRLPWKAAIVGLLALDVLISVLAWLRGWTIALAAANVVANLASGGLLLWLLYADRLLTDVPAEFARVFDVPADWTLSTTAVAVGIVAVSAWDAVSGVLRARRGAQPGIP